MAGFENRIHEKDSRNQPPSAAATERNSIKSKIRARLKHVYDCYSESMWGTFTRIVGIKKNKARWSLKILYLIACASNIFQTVHG